MTQKASRQETVLRVMERYFECQDSEIVASRLAWIKAADGRGYCVTLRASKTGLHEARGCTLEEAERGLVAFVAYMISGRVATNKSLEAWFQPALDDLNACLEN